MTTQIITSDIISSDQTALSVSGEGSRVVVLPDVVVAVQRTGAQPDQDFAGIRTLDANQSVTMGGFVTGDYGLYLDGSGVRVEVTSSGQVVGNDVAGIAVRGNSGFIVNGGFIGGQTGIDGSAFMTTFIANNGTISGVNGIDMLGGVRLTNTGSIFATQSAVRIAEGFVSNSGTISGNSHGISTGSSGFASIINSGTISGVDSAVTLRGLGHELLNTGLIQGGVSVTQGGATIDTREGTITGFVGLIGSNNTYIGGAGRDWVGGQISGSIVDLGAGNDLFRLGGLFGGNEVEGGAGVDVLDARSFASVEIDLTQGTVGTGPQREDGFTGFEQVRGTGGADRLTGDSAANRLTGDTGNDTLNGAAGNDRLIGGNDHDVLDGGSGNDIMLGGAGNDTYVVDAAGDRVFETTTTSSTTDAGGIDTVLSAVSFDLAASVGVSFVERLTLTGNAAINGTGNALANTIVGNTGANTLNGAAGNDTLTGGTGADSFVFNTALGPSNIDRITDFNAVADTIRLENAIFTGLPGGTLAATAFVANTSGNAADASDRIIYESDTGRLFFDTDGTGATAKVHFATLATGLTLTSADFFVF